MLVLSRKKNESIQIDSMIRIMVISIGKGRVKLGITAPEHVRIVRNELMCCESDEANAWPEKTTIHEVATTS